MLWKQQKKKIEWIWFVWKLQSYECQAHWIYNSKFFEENKCTKYTRHILDIQYNEALRLQWSINSNKLMKENNPVADIQSNNVLENCSLRSKIVRSHSLKIQPSLTPQAPHQTAC